MVVLTMVSGHVAVRLSICAFELDTPPVVRVVCDGLRSTFGFRRYNLTTKPYGSGAVNVTLQGVWRPTSFVFRTSAMLDSFPLSLMGYSPSKLQNDGSVDCVDLDVAEVGDGGVTSLDADANKTLSVGNYCSLEYLNYFGFVYEFSFKEWCLMRQSVKKHTFWWLIEH